MTQETLARLLGVSNQAVSKWESGICCPDIQLLPKLADIFEITLDELFGRQTLENPQHNDLPWDDDDALRAVLYLGREPLFGFTPAKEAFFMMQGMKKPCLTTNKDSSRKDCCQK